MIVTVTPLWQYRLLILIFTAVLEEPHADPISAGNSESSRTAGIFSFGSSIFQASETGPDSANVVITRSGGDAGVSLPLLFGDLLLPADMESIAASFGAGELSKTINFFDIVGSSPDLAELPEIHLQITPFGPSIASLSSQPSESATLLMRLAPQILAPLADIEASAGKSVQLAVTATGAPRPSFQWLKNGFRLINETNAALQIGAPGTADAGAYAVLVSNTAGSTTSEANLKVIQASAPAPTHSSRFPDLLFQSDDGFLSGWTMDEYRVVSASYLTPAKIGDTNWRCIGWADFNQDTHPDLFFQNRDGTMAVWYMDGDRQTSAALINPSNPGDPRWTVAGIGDFNQDGRPDLIFQHTDGTLAVWLLDQVQSTSAVFLIPNQPEDPGLRLIAAGDFDRDGNDDLVFQHTNGTIVFWLLNGTSRKQTITLPRPSANDALWRVVGQTDLNRDGKPDLLFQHRDNGALAVWYMNGTAILEAHLLEPSNAFGTWRMIAR